MAGVRFMLARVQRLEQAGTPAPSPFGPLEAWEAECQAGIYAGYLDSHDVPVVMMAVRRWDRDGVWAR